jgi:acyl-CoA hydrolase/RimJ/RimL family protein N-acetyltransferase
MNWQEKYADKRTTADEAVLRIPRGKHIFVGAGASEPVGLVNALGRQAQHFADNTIVHLMTLGPAPYVGPEYQSHFRHNAFFIGSNVRAAVHEGRADYTPVFLSRIPELIRSRRMPVEVALVQCTPPDKFGFVNLGVSVDVILAAIDAARLVIAEINPNVPVIHGAGFLPMSKFDAWTFHDAPMMEHVPDPPGEVELEIGRNVASLVEDGSTLQTGIGQLPDATLKALTEKRDLGIWTEMFSDGVIDLIERGVITGKYKTIHRGKISASFTFGTKRLYEYLDHNPLFTFHGSDFINNPITIAQQHKMVAINSALEVDLTGQVCADSIGTKFYSGIGGQVDFIRGASMCPGGKPIIALRSTAKDGTLSRIVPTLTKGAGVVTSRGDVRYVVTEHGVADLLGKSIRERAVALVSIAHPDFRAELLREAKERHYVFIDELAPQGKYPREIERRVKSRDGLELQLRPIRSTDEPKLTEMLYSLTEATLYQRFLHIIKRSTHEERRPFLDVDYKTNFGIVLETCNAELEPEIVGVAHYFLDPATQLADVAFLVRDPWQGKGLGTILVSETMRCARERDIDGFTADVLASNRAMLHLFHKAGLVVESVVEGEVCRLKMRWPDGQAETIVSAN